MRKLKLAALLLVAIGGWTAFIILGITDGFLLRSIASGDASEDFIAAAEHEIAQSSVGNVALVVIEDGRVDGSTFYSVGEPVTEETVFPVASVSKWVTAWGVFALVEGGVLDLDAPVDSYLTRWHLPESEFDNSAVTIRKLLSHTSGLVDDLGYAGFAPGEPVQTLEESLTQAADAPWSEGKAVVGMEPGSQYMYSGAAYTLLQLVIEEVTGQAFQDYMTEAVFEPLQMTRSTFVLPSDSAQMSAGWDVATRYDGDGDIAPQPTFTALAAASLFTTASDMARFVKANAGPNPVLSPETLDAMYTPQAFVGTTGIHATGPTIFARDGDGLFIHGHDGSGSSLNTAARLDRATGDGIVVFETGHPNLASSLADHWIFWKTGIADFVVITANKSWLITLLLLGYVVIIAASVFLIRRSPRPAV